MVKNWELLTPRDQLRVKRDCVKDVRFFYRNPYMLNFDPYPVQDEISWNLIHRNEIRDSIALLGMRAGKTTIGGGISAYYLFRMSLIQDPARLFRLLPRSPIRMTNMATSKEQGKETIFDFFKNFVEESPYFKEISDLEIQVEKIILHDRNFKAISLSSSSGSSVGKTSVLTCFDEADLFDDTDKKDGIQQVWSRVTKATKTLRKISNGEYGKTLTISSFGEFPIGGFMERMLVIAKNAPHMLGYKLSTWEANPLYTKDDFKEDFITDYAGTMRDFGSDARAVGSTFIKDVNIINKSINPDRRNFFSYYFSPDREKNVDIFRSMLKDRGEFYLTGDPSLKHDSFGIALGHSSGKDVQIALQRDKEIEIVSFKNIIIDGLWRLKPKDYRLGEIDPAHVEDIFLDICNHIPITSMAFDTWAFPILQAKVKRMGIAVDNQIIRRNECLTLKQMMQYGAIDICDYEPFRTEAEQLMDNGKRVDHPKNGSKDVWDAVALIAWAAQQPNQPIAPYRPSIIRRF